MASRSLSARLWVWLAIAASTQACAQPPQQPGAVAGDCSARIIVGFRGPTDSAAVAALASAHDFSLSVVNRLLPDLYVLDLGARGDTGCAAALERLRGDARVRSVELDARRGPNVG